MRLNTPSGRPLIMYVISSSASGFYRSLPSTPGPFLLHSVNISFHFLHHTVALSHNCNNRAKSSRISQKNHHTKFFQPGSPDNAFLEFCFDKFEVGIWSLRTKYSSTIFNRSVLIYCLYFSICLSSFLYQKDFNCSLLLFGYCVVDLQFPISRKEFG